MSNNTPSTSSSPPVAVKKEKEEETKEFSETAMNELLGWYGYERLEFKRWAASRAKDTSSPEQTSDNKDKDVCSWCNKNITSENEALQQAGATFCSELCFSQSRRANFKRAKTCDWCRHVRHTVAYVDFQDGATQLQFCSDKCLNQYKMHIFCRETQAHLDLNPHLVQASSSSNLITPELWLKNCKSRSTSPHSDRSSPPVPENLHKTQNGQEKSESKQKSPIITVASTAKLMKKSEERPTQKSPDTKKDLKTKLNLRKRRVSKTATITSQSIRHDSTPKAQDLRMCSPSTLDGSSPMSNTASNISPTHPMNPMPPPFPNPLFGMPAPMYMENMPHPDPRLTMFPPRPSFLPRSMHLPERHIPSNLNCSTVGQAPPVTVFIPYPVVLPIPLPIPIPLPLSAFLQAQTPNVKTESKFDEEGPLDFTMNTNKAKTPERSEAEELQYNQDHVQRVEPDRINEISSPEQTLPKFKITRLSNKLAKISPKSKEPAESTRPLRKRRRLVEVATDEDSLLPKTRKIVEV